MRVYTLKTLAELEGVTHTHLRAVLVRYKNGEINHWRDYRFFGIDGKCWFAYHKDKKLEFINTLEKAKNA